IFTDSGLIFITNIPELDDYEAQILKKLNEPNDIMVINVGECMLNKFPVDAQFESDISADEAVKRSKKLLTEKQILPEYFL
ncbi:MAG: adenylyl-sulfate kinase, partial [Candidatus Margulisbacteria bacterium]|nr:adenylyl-sulfate kinase [Candidatus Margulisiibacteriota bacterium]